MYSLKPIRLFPKTAAAASWGRRRVSNGRTSQQVKNGRGKGDSISGGEIDSAGGRRRADCAAHRRSEARRPKPPTAALSAASPLAARSGGLHGAPPMVVGTSSGAVAILCCHALASHVGVVAGAGVALSALLLGLLAIGLAAMGQRDRIPAWLWAPVLAAWLIGSAACAASLWLPGVRLPLAVLGMALAGLYFEMLAFLASCPDEKTRAAHCPDLALAGLAVGVWLLLVGLLTAGTLAPATLLGALCFLTGCVMMPRAETALYSAWTPRPQQSAQLAWIARGAKFPTLQQGVACHS
jgi:hypothetical protein